MPLPSPTTTSAVKLKRRPPLATFATRLMATTRSTNADFSGTSPRRLSRSRRSRRSPPPAGAPAVLRCCAAISESFASVRTWFVGSAPSQGQATLTGAFGHRRNPAVVLVAAAVEHDGVDACSLRAGGDELAYLAADLLAGVPNTLALVGLGLADLTDVRRDLAHLLLVDATDRQLGRALHREGDAGRGRHRNRVREAEGELEARALGRHTVAGSDDLQLLLVAVRDAGDEIRQERSGEAVQRTGNPLVVRTGHHNGAQLVAVDLDGRGNGVREGALRALH